MMHIESLKQNMSLVTDPNEKKQLKKACKELESVFLGYLLKSMRKTVTKTDLFGSSRNEEIFQDMLDSEVCQSASKTSSVGIADMLYRQLSGDSGQQDKPDTNDTRGRKP